MARGFSFRASTSLKTSVRVDPKVILGSRLVALSAAELDAEIQREMEENPALIRLDEQEPLTDRDLYRKLAPDQLRLQSEDYEFARSGQDLGNECHWTDFAGQPDSLHDHLWAQISSTPGYDPELDLYVIESLDERGYLGLAKEEIALACGRSLEAVDASVARLQACEPAGIAAEGLIPCLILQLQRESSPLAALAIKLLENQLPLVLDHQVKVAARRLGIEVALAEQVFALIRSLNPEPGRRFDSLTPEAPRASAELSLLRTESGWQIQVRGVTTAELSVDRTYQQLAGAKGDSAQHARHFVARAERFLSALELRQQTLTRLGAYLIEKQGGFVTTGDLRFVNDLTRCQVAKEIGIHESTISRATMNKFVEIATGEVVAFDLFFDSSLRVKEMIGAILRTENPGKPLSDQRIAEILASQGVQVARRTVNKYRDHSKLLSSRRRKAA